MEPLVIGDEICCVENTLKAAGDTFGPMLHAVIITEKGSTLATPRQPGNNCFLPMKNIAPWPGLMVSWDNFQRNSPAAH